MSLTYVIPDIHGRHDLLIKALADIAVRAGDEAATIVTLGDYVDKGPDSKHVIDLMLSGVDEEWRFDCAEGQSRRPDGAGVARPIGDGVMDREGRRHRAGLLWRRTGRCSARPYRLARRAAADACCG